jgi:hypothetical protein
MDFFDNLNVCCFDALNSVGESCGVVGPCKPDGVVFFPFRWHGVAEISASFACTAHFCTPSFFCKRNCRCRGGGSEGNPSLPGYAYSCPNQPWQLITSSFAVLASARTFPKESQTNEPPQNSSSPSAPTRLTAATWIPFAMAWARWTVFQASCQSPSSEV